MSWYFSLESGTFDWFIIFLFWVGLTLSSSVFGFYVYLDSKKRKIKDAEIFIIFAFLLNITGLIFYLALRRVYPRNKTTDLKF